MKQNTKIEISYDRPLYTKKFPLELCGPWRVRVVNDSVFVDFECEWTEQSRERVESYQKIFGAIHYRREEWVSVERKVKGWVNADYISVSVTVIHETYLCEVK